MKDVHTPTQVLGVSTNAALFGIPTLLGSQEVHDAGSWGSFVPQVDPEYVFAEKSLKRLSVWALNMAGKNLLVTGHTGAGKSSLIEQFCGRINKPVFRVGSHGRLEFPDIVSRVGFNEEGKMEVFYLAVVNAMRSGGVLLVDEFNFLPPAAVGALNGLLDGAPLLIEQTGELIEPHPAFRIAFTGNAVTGDTGMYRGIQRSNIALLDRFLAMEVDYAEESQEFAILNGLAKASKPAWVRPPISPGVNSASMKRQDIPDAIKTAMIGVANKVRESFKGSADIGSSTTLSTRTLVRWAMVLSIPMKLSSPAEYIEKAKEALCFALLDRCPPDERRATLELVDTLFPQK